MEPIKPGQPSHSLASLTYDVVSRRKQSLTPPVTEKFRAEHKRLEPKADEFVRGRREPDALERMIERLRAKAASLPKPAAAEEAPVPATVTNDAALASPLAAEATASSAPVPVASSTTSTSTSDPVAPATSAPVATEPAKATGQSTAPGQLRK
jgi:hypothetical protein